MNKEIDVLPVDGRGMISIVCKCKNSKKVDAPHGKYVINIKCPCGAKRKVRSEHRKSLRKKFENSGTIIYGDKKKKYFVRMTDLSLGGIGFEVLSEVNLIGEAEISFILDVSKREEMDVTLNLKIVSQRGKRYGAEFVDMPEYCQIKKDIYWWLREEQL